MPALRARNAIPLSSHESTVLRGDKPANVYDESSATDVKSQPHHPCTKDDPTCANENCKRPAGTTRHDVKGNGKRARTLLTTEQSRVLHELLQQTCFPSTQVREEVAAKLGLSPRKVQVFFQNKRQKQRKKASIAGPPPTSTPICNETVTTRGGSAECSGPHTPTSEYSPPVLPAANLPVAPLDVLEARASVMNGPIAHGGTLSEYEYHRSMGTRFLPLRNMHSAWPLHGTTPCFRMSHRELPRSRHVSSPFEIQPTRRLYQDSARFSSQTLAPKALPPLSEPTRPPKTKLPSIAELMADKY